MIRDSTTALVIFTILLVTFVVFLANAHGEITYYDRVKYNDFNIDLFIVNDIEDMPCGNVGCAIYGYLDGEPYNAIFLYDKYINIKDAWGYSAYYHELKHILCQCDWHEGLRWV